jgi:hypothetical protein
LLGPTFWIRAVEELVKNLTLYLVSVASLCIEGLPGHVGNTTCAPGLLPVPGLTIENVLKGRAREGR